MSCASMFRIPSKFRICLQSAFYKGSERSRMLINTNAAISLTLSEDHCAVSPIEAARRARARSRHHAHEEMYFRKAMPCCFLVEWTSRCGTSSSVVRRCSILRMKFKTTHNAISKHHSITGIAIFELHRMTKGAL